MHWYCWLGDCFRVIADVGKYPLFAARSLKYADSLTMTQQGFVEVVDAAGIFGQESLEKLVRGLRRNFFADQAQADTHAMDVHVNW